MSKRLTSPVKKTKPAPAPIANGLKPSPIAKRSIVIAGHKTSVSLEDPFWKRLKEEALEQNLTLSILVDTIDKKRRHGNLSSALRLHVVARLEQLAGLSETTVMAHG